MHICPHDVLRICTSSKSSGSKTATTNASTLAAAVSGRWCTTHRCALCCAAPCDAISAGSVERGGSLSVPSPPELPSSGYELSTTVRPWTTTPPQRILWCVGTSRTALGAENSLRRRMYLGWAPWGWGGSGPHVRSDTSLLFRVISLSDDGASGRVYSQPFFFRFPTKPPK
jgi:hypothetical protein